MTGAEFLAYINRTFKRLDKTAETYEAIRDTIVDMKTQFAFDEFNDEEHSTALDTVGDYKIDLPTDFNHLTGEVRCYENETNAKTPRKVTKHEFDRLYPNPSDADTIKGFPEHFCIYGGQILVGPPVDKTTYSVDFSYSSEEELTINALTVDVPFSGKYRECLKFGTLMRLYVDLEKDDAAVKWKGFYDTELEKIATSERRNSAACGSTEYQDL